MKDFFKAVAVTTVSGVLIHVTLMELRKTQRYRNS